jgi:hypothetical protein
MVPKGHSVFVLKGVTEGGWGVFIMEYFNVMCRDSSIESTSELSLKSVIFIQIWERGETILVMIPKPNSR